MAAWRRSGDTCCVPKTAASVSRPADGPAGLGPDEGLLELGRLALLGRLTRGVVHELNNPLFVVLALAELMQRTVEPGSQAAERLAQVHESGSEMRRLVGAIGELARGPVAGPPEPLPLAAVLLESVALIRRVTLRKDIDIVERYDDADASVLAPRGELRLALLGLLVDAQEGTPEEGRIEVVSLRAGGRVQVAVRWPGGRDDAVPVQQLDGILAALVEARGGTLRLGASAAGGCEAVLSLPLHAG